MQVAPTMMDEQKINQARRIAYLLSGFEERTLTAWEEEELDEWAIESDENLLLFAKLAGEKDINAYPVSQNGYGLLKTQLALANYDREQRRQMKRIWLFASLSFILCFALAVWIYVGFRGQH